jgi:hypothetical protein
MSNSEPEPEWTPAYVRAARANAGEAARDVRSGGSEALALASAVRELAAEVRALRHQLAGGTPPAKGGALGELGETLWQARPKLGK